MRFGEALQRVGGPRVVDPAPRHDYRAFGRLDRGDRTGQLSLIGADAALIPDARLKKAFGIIIGLGLYVLAKSQRYRTTIGRIGHRAEGTRQGSQQMLGPRDTVKIATDRAETVICASGPIGEIFSLLQHRIGSARGKDIAGQEQDRQTVHMRQRSRRHHVGRPRSDRRGYRHRTGTPHLLGIGNRAMRHGLLIVTAVSR